MTIQGYAAEARVVRERFALMWWDDVKGEPITPVAWEDEHFEPPAGPGGLRSWVRVTVFGSNASRASLGGTSARYRHDGEVIVEVWAPGNRGGEEARELADAAASVFRSAREDSMQFWTPRVIRVGREGQWFRLNVIASFKRDSVFETS
jgi:hypothetical protein